MKKLVILAVGILVSTLLFPCTSYGGGAFESLWGKSQGEVLQYFKNTQELLFQTYCSPPKSGRRPVPPCSSKLYGILNLPGRSFYLQDAEAFGEVVLVFRTDNGKFCQARVILWTEDPREWLFACARLKTVFEQRFGEPVEVDLQTFTGYVRWLGKTTVAAIHWYSSSSMGRKTYYLRVDYYSRAYYPHNWIHKKGGSG